MKFSPTGKSYQILSINTTLGPASDSEATSSVERFVGPDPPSVLEPKLPARRFVVRLSLPVKLVTSVS